MNVLNFAISFLGIFLFIILSYAYFSYSLMVIAKRTKTENSWLAWIPFANFWLLVQIAGKDILWFILLFIPLINIVVSVIILMETAKKLGKNELIGILSLIPLVNYFVPAILAYSTKKEEKLTSNISLVLSLVSSFFLIIALGFGSFSIVKNWPAIMANTDSIDTEYINSSKLTDNEQNIPTPQTFPSVTVTVPDSEEDFDKEKFYNWQANAIYYWNCKYWYSLYYPLNMSNNSMTFESDNVLIYDNGLTISVDAFILSSYLSLDDFATVRQRTIAGSVIGNRDKTRNNTRIIAYEYKNPSLSVVYWQSSDAYMEMRISGNNYLERLETVSFILAGLNTYPDSLDCPSYYYPEVNIDEEWGGDVPYCDYENDPDCWPGGIIPDNENYNIYEEDYDTDIDPACSFPNGDIDQWWMDVSQEVRDCYISIYGDPIFAK